MERERAVRVQLRADSEQERTKQLEAELQGTREQLKDARKSAPSR